MECKSLILGIVFCIGIFAVKSGVGLHYYLSRTASARAKTGAWTVFSLTYFSLFCASGFVLEKLDLMQHMAALQAWIQSGMIIHLVMAGLLLLWGLRLLREHGRKHETMHGKSRGWLLLAIPCPVCATVIFLSLSFLTACYPDGLSTAALCLFFVYLSVTLATVRVMAAGSKGQNASPEVILGGAMMLIAVYFLLSVTVMPQFADADKIYRMSLASSENSPQAFDDLIFFALFIALTFAGGFAFTLLNIWRDA
ncbi:MAG: DUF2162 family putative transporter [Desulfobacterales bacterium]